MRRREVSWWAVALAALAVAVYLPHVLHGGFHNDDWANHNLVANGLSASDLRFVNLFYAHRPVYVAYSPFVYWLFQGSNALHIAYMVGLGWLAAVLAFALLRRLGVPPWVAGAVAAFLLVWPFSDGVRLWLAASGMSLALALMLGGYLLSTYAWGTWWRHAVAVALMVTSILLFEVAAGFLALGVVVHLRTAPTRRAALARWAADLAACGTAMMIWTLHAKSSYHRNTDAALLRNVQRYLRDFRSVLGMTFHPDGHRHEALGRAVVVAALVVLLAALWRKDVRRWAALVVAGFVVAMAGWAPFVAADPLGYGPLLPGGQNRTNVAATLGVGLLVVALLGGLATLLLGRWQRVAAVVAVCATVGVLTAGAARTRTDVRDWDRGYALALHDLAVVKRLAPAPPRGQVLLMYGVPTAYDYGIPVIGGSVDATNALRLYYGRDDLVGVSMVRGTRLDCEAFGPTAVGAFVITAPTGYGRTTAVDVATGDLTEIRNVADCRYVVSRYAPGPIFAVDHS